MFAIMLKVCVSVIAMLALCAWSRPAFCTAIPADERFVRSLDGNWRFKLEQALPEYATAAQRNWHTRQPVLTPETFEPFFQVDYREDSDWDDMTVPCNWEMLGYSPVTYNEPDNTSGFFRKWFEIPKNWEGRRVLVNFDGVQNGAQVWLNGEPVTVSEPSNGRSNYHESGWTAWQAELTPHVKFGQKNLLALRVVKNTPSSDLDSGDYFLLGGIYRPVALFAVPNTCIEDYTVVTNLLQGNEAAVKVSFVLSEMATEPLSLRLSIDKDGGMTSVSCIPNGVTGEMSMTLDDPDLWSAEHPNLYAMTIELLNGDTLLEEIKTRIGIREVTIEDGVLKLNGVPIKLTGICRHDIDPDLGTAVGEKLWRRDLELMREANINSVRTSHYPYGSGFYDLCDEMGFYVLDELPYCWCKTDDEEKAPAFLQRARETVRRDKNHPCVIIWGIGNENHSGSNLQKVADLMKELDPTRPNLVSCKQADEFGTDFDDQHYVPPARMAQDAAETDRRAKWPQIYTETPNVWDIRLAADYGCWDIWYLIQKRTWDEIWKTDAICGAYLWEWQDRAVKDKCPVKPYEVDPETGIHYLKIKGVVDVYRNPRPEHYHLKMVHSPIVVGPSLEKKSAAVVLDVTNRYSFTNLDELETRWELSKKSEPIGNGVERLPLAPRSSAKIELPMPSEALSQADSIRVAFFDSDGLDVVTFQIKLQADEESEEIAFPPADFVRFPTFRIVANDTHGDKSKWMVIDRYHGILKNLQYEYVGSSEDMSITNVRAMQADVVLDNNLTIVVGHVKATLEDGQFSYRFDWLATDMDIQELGWVFDLPRSCDRFSWDHETPWSYYPVWHIGRPRGTARPDSANVPVTRISRPDAYDFNSTKYNCNLASLTDENGQGIVVQFQAEDRHHVRSDFGPEGYQLVVNKQCSPPIDLSTHCVPDIYMKLKPRDSVEGHFRVGSGR